MVAFRAGTDVPEPRRAAKPFPVRWSSLEAKDPPQVATTRFSRIATSYAFVVGVLAMLVGSVVLCGWLFGVIALTNFAPGVPTWPPMAPLTAVAMMLCGAAMGLGRSGRHRRAAICCAGLATLMCLLRFTSFLTSAAAAPDTMVSEALAALHGMQIVGMTPATGCGFALLAVAEILAVSGRARRTHQLCALLTLLVGWLGFTHFIYGGAPIVAFSRMAIHTALMLMMLALGALALRPQQGLAALWVDGGVAGQSLRRLLPAALIVPLAAGALAQYAKNRAWFGPEADLALLALFTVMVFAGLVWANAAQLERADTERRSAAQQQRAQVERLKLLDRTTRAIGERQDLHSIFTVVVRSLEEHLPIDFGCIALREPQQQSLRIAGFGVKDPALAQALGVDATRIDIEHNGLSGVERGETLYEPNTAASLLPFPARLALAGLHALVISPLTVEGEIFGVLICARATVDSFSAAEREFLRQLSEHLALATHQAQLYSSLQQAYEDLRRTQESAVQQERLRALGQMASGIAHDINNALSPAALYAQSLLERNQSLDEQARAQLTVIERAIEDVGETVSRMREFYRPREVTLNVTPVDLNALLQQVADLTRARWHDMAQERGVVIRLHTELAQALPPAVGAENEIRDALTNTVLNAVDAMPEGGTLSLRTRRMPDAGLEAGSSDAARVCVEIGDTGIGMSEEVRSRCIEPFFTTKGERGTGLGLAMVYGMLERHGGSLEIDSAPGRGTTVRLIFPSTAHPVARPAPVRSALQPLRLLIVDDDRVLLKSLRETLEADGCIVRSADHGQAGIDMFTSARQGGEIFDAVITDLGMPTVNGYGVAAAIKAMSPHTPLILLTGWGHKLQTQKRPEHIDRILAKPPRLVELRTVLTELTQQAAPASLPVLRQRVL